MKNLNIVLVALLAGILSSCCSCGKGQSEIMIEQTSWELEQLQGRDVSTNDNYKITFNSDGTVSGIGDCNRFMGKYTKTKDNKLSFENLALTKMMCQNQEQEDKFIKTLSSIDAIRTDGKLLMMLSNGELVAIFEAED